MRALVQATAAQDHAFAAHPFAQHLPRHLSRRLHFAGLSIDLAARLRATHDAAGTMHRRVERGALFVAIAGSAGENHRVVAHRAAHEALLPREGRCRALAHDDVLLALVLFRPGEVVMIVDELPLPAAENGDDLTRDPLSAGVRVL